jgi:hypothetical protein
VARKAKRIALDEASLRPNNGEIGQEPDHRRFKPEGQDMTDLHKLLSPTDPLRASGAAATRRTALIAGAGLVLAAASPLRLAAEESGSADFLFVQTASAMSHDAAAGTVTLEGVSPVTLFFADRPDRIAGNMRTEAFVPFWSKGKDSFLKDPPNADLSLMVDGALQQTVVVLRDPELVGDKLTYRVEVISGSLPATAKEVSVFIDVIGMPLTPVSYAGVARRSFRRAALY